MRLFRNLTLMALIAGIILVPPGNAQTVGNLFYDTVNYDVGDIPYSVVSADFNGDGDNDLAVVNEGSNNVSILLNKGDGTFHEAVNYGVGYVPTSVSSADFNGDNYMDLVVVNFASVSVSILLNVDTGTGYGTFVEHAEIGLASYPYAVCCADLNGNGFGDLAVTHRGVDSVSILLNHGSISATFDAPVRIEVGDNPILVISADFDGDGDNDLATANSGSHPTSYGTITVLINQGGGTFAEPVHYGAGIGSCSAFSADFDEDEKLDLAVANVFSDNVSILLNVGGGIFAKAADYNAGDSPQAVVAADFNGDGDYDLAVPNAFSDNVSILLGRGDGTFGEADNYDVGDVPIAIFAADFNGDCMYDLAVPNVTPDNVSILINRIIPADSDGDAKADICDNCPEIPNPDQEDFDVDGVGDVCDNCPDDYNPGQEDIDSNDVGDICDAGYTGDGSDVIVALTDSITVIFDSVSVPGSTTINQSTTGPPPPDGFKVVPSAPPIYYTITTTAVIEDSVTICFNYDPSIVRVPEHKLRIFLRDPTWIDVTVQPVDTANNVICARIGSLPGAARMAAPAPFGLAEPCCGIFTGDRTGNANCSEDGKLTLSDITKMIDRVYVSKEPLCCRANGNTNADSECKITLSDITVLVDAVYISKADPEPCISECEQ